MNLYLLKYTNEEVDYTYGIFSSQEKAEYAKSELIKDVEKDDWAKDFYNREIYIAKVKSDVITRRIEW